MVGIKPQKYGKTDVVARDICKVINEITLHEGLAVLAHSNSSKGVISEMRGVQRETVFFERNLLAVEVTDTDFSEEKRKKRTRAVDLLDGTNKDYGKRKLGVYQASDNPHVLSDGEFSGHSIDGIGRRFSYFKVDDIVALESLRQCFIDRDVRIRQSWEISHDDSSKLPFRYPHISKLAVKGGFLDGLDIDFHTGLTTILGAKGTGKSLLIELIRFVLDQEPTQSQILEDHNHKLETKLGKYSEVEITFFDEVDAEYSFRRTHNTIEGNPYNDEELSPDITRIFPVIFLSQNEIIRIAESENEQMNFIDKFFDFRSFQNQIRGFEDQLREMDGQFADSLRAVHEKRLLIKEIQVFNEQIKKINVQLKNSIFERFEKAQKKYHGFLALKEYLENLLGTAQEFDVALEDVGFPELEKIIANDPAIKRYKDVCRKATDDVSEGVSKITSKVKQSINKAKKEFTDYVKIYEKEKENYEKEVKRLGGDYEALNYRRDQMLNDLRRLQKKYDLVRTKAEKVAKLNVKREALLNELTATYAAYSEKRNNKCKDFENFSGSRIKASVKVASDANEFKERLLNLKKGSRLKDQVVEGISKGIKPSDFILNLLRYDFATDNREKYIQKFSKDADVKLDHVQQLADYLLQNEYEELLSLQYQAVPKDRPEIMVEIGEDRYELLNDVSTGQKCAALLIIALCDGNTPVVVDQPEDSLDIRSIWEDMCIKLRKGKENRQFIFTSHNSSLAVASDTDKYIVLEATASQGELVYCGAIDNNEIKEEIVKYLEGGLPTYSLKHSKYDLGKRMH